VEKLQLNEALANVMSYVNRINGYLEQTAPWALAKQRGRQGEIDTALYTAAEALRLASILLWPVMPERIKVLWTGLGWQAPHSLHDGLQWGDLEPGTAVSAEQTLFPKDIIKERLVVSE
jgi:methionyl-tRNA synthetase